MGTDKAFLRLGRLTLLEQAIATSKEVSATVALVGNKEQLRPYGWVIEDEFPGQGPLAGIHAALKSKSASDLNIFLAVDLPGVPSSLLKYLLKVAGESGKVVTAPYANGFSQPLCAVYRRDFAVVAEKALQAGHNKIDALYREVSVRRVEQAELAALEIPASVFDNVNTPEDWDRMQRRLEATQG
jgi:molybdopterin-guanine dinucleotide biosynthesis protein A